MIFNFTNSKYDIEISSLFKSQYKKIRKQGKDINKLISILETLANGEILDPKYKNHKLINNKIYKECYECHIEPDWLLIYKYQDNNLILLLFATGTHSDLFNK